MFKFKLIFLIFTFLCLIKSGFGFCDSKNYCNCTSNEYDPDYWIAECPIKNPNIKIKYNNKSLWIECKTDDLITEILPHDFFKQNPLTIRMIRFINCNIPNGITSNEISDYLDLSEITFLEIIFKKLLNLDDNFINGFGDLTHLLLTNVGFTNIWNIVKKFPNLHVLYLLNNNITSTVKLNLPKLQILSISDKELQFIDSETIVNSPNLFFLKIKNLKVDFLSESVDKVYTRDTTSTRSEFLNEDKEIKSLNTNFLNNRNFLSGVIINIGLHEVDEDFFTNMDSLEVIDLSRNNLYKLPIGLFRGLKDLKGVDLSYNNIEILDDSIFIENTKLRDIDLSNNKLLHISTTIFNPCRALSELQLQNNELQTFNFNAALHERLHKVNLGYNSLILNDDCLFTNLHGSIKVGLANNNIEDFTLLKCLLNNSFVRELDLSENHIQRIMKSDIDVERTKSIKLNLTNNQIHDIEFWNSLEFISNETLFCDYDDNVKPSKKFRIEMKIDGNPMFCGNCSFLENQNNLKQLNAVLKYEEATEVVFNLKNSSCLDIGFCPS